MGHTARFVPSGGLKGSARIPADKSISHRAAMIAAICDSPVPIRNFLRADDTNSTLKAVAACGARVENLEQGDPVVSGAGLRGLRSPGQRIDVGNSGTTIRLLPGILAGQEGTFMLDGDDSIRRRPMDRIVTPLSRMGVKIEAREGRFAPLTVTGGPVKAITYEMPMASAQVKSAVLLGALFADGSTQVVEPAVCRDHTEIMLSRAGAHVEQEGLKTTIYPANELHLDEVEVVADFSSAAFFMAAAAVVPGSDIVLKQIGVNPTRTGLMDIMKEMGADISLVNERWAGGEMLADIRVRSSDLQGVEVGGEIIGRAIDELPLVALLGAFAEGDTVVREAAELKVKESDRIAGLAAGMSGLGVGIEPTADGFVVHGETGVRGGAFESLGDHRLAMLGAVAGLASREGVDVSGFDCVTVSFPEFEETLGGLLSR